jgi:fructose-specific phosphotransferase system IIC component
MSEDPSAAPPASPAEKPAVQEYAANALSFGCGCAFVLPIAVLFLGILYHIFDKRCGTPGDSGGCEMGIASAVIAAVIPGIVIGIISGLVVTWRERGKRLKK